MQLFQDPLGTGEFLRRTRDNEAVDGQGTKYYIERKTQVELPPLGALFVAFLSVVVALVLMGCGGMPSPQPVYEQLQPTQAANW